jgi:hypothetical protein
MTRALEQAIAQLRKLPEVEQDRRISLADRWLREPIHVHILLRLNATALASLALCLGPVSR